MDFLKNKNMKIFLNPTLSEIQKYLERNNQMNLITSSENISFLQKIGYVRKKHFFLTDKKRIVIYITILNP